MSELSPALAAFYDDCTYWANFARDKEKTMTLILELPVEVENELRQAAAARGVPVEDFAVERLRRSGESARPTPAQGKRAAALAGLGALAGTPRTVDDFLADRHAEGEEDYDKWAARQKDAA